VTGMLRHPQALVNPLRGYGTTDVGPTRFLGLQKCPNPGHLDRVSTTQAGSTNQGGSDKATSSAARR
jgi:hypothetical protein